MAIYEITEAGNISDETVPTGIVSLNPGLAEHLAVHNLIIAQPTPDDARSVGKELLKVLGAAGETPGESILPALNDGPMTPGEIAGYSSQDYHDVEKRLHALQRAGVVTCEPEGSHTLYSLPSAEKQ